MHHKRRPTEAAPSRTDCLALDSPTSCRVAAAAAANQQHELAPARHRFGGAFEQVSEPSKISAVERGPATCGNDEQTSRGERLSEANRWANWPIQTMSEHSDEAAEKNSTASSLIERPRRVYLNNKPAAIFKLPQATHRITTRTWLGRETRLAKQAALLLAVMCLISGWPTHRTATASIGNEQGRGDEQLARQLIDIHRRIHILNRITQLASASKHRQQLAEAGLWEGPTPAQLANSPQPPQPPQPFSLQPSSDAGDKVAPLRQMIADGAIKHLNPNELEEWSRGRDMVRTFAMHHHKRQQKPQPHPSRLRSTTPTLDRQLPGPPGQQVAAPTAGYELGFAPTDAVQLDLRPEAPAEPSQGQQQQQQQQQRQQQQQQQQLAHQHEFEPLVRSPSRDWQISSARLQLEPAESVVRPTFWQPPPSPPTSNSSSTTARPRDSRAMFESAEAGASNSGAKSGPETSRDPGEPASTGSQSAPEVGGDSEANSDNNGSNQERSQSGSPLRAEPRQKRRIFNRILKKAEWNHLFLELSKVFLRYFLDLALKDIIGKQSGSTSSDSSTTGRKKLEVQSELADMLKEFIKTAITNI